MQLYAYHIPQLLTIKTKTATYYDHDIRGPFKFEHIVIVVDVNVVSCRWLILDDLFCGPEEGRNTTVVLNYNYA